MSTPTATLARPATGAPPKRRKRSWRWVRAVAPFVVLLIIYGVTMVAHVAEEPDLRDPGTLSPTGTGRDGSSQLAGLLEARGVRIDRVDSPSRALSALGLGDGTVFVPTPEFVGPQLVARVAGLPGRHRVVVVAPGPVSALFWAPSAYALYPSRWAAKAVEPGCDDPLARQAGRAATLRARYAVEGAATRDCYDGGLVGVRLADTEVVLVGASDPFRNGRIDEQGNAQLAVGLLGELGRVVWLDVHASDPTNLPPVDISLPEYHRPETDRSGGGGPSIWDAFPPALWASLALAAALAVLVGLVRGRRLGPPVAEPLPVLVPAAETVTGRGRLYHRIHARGATLDALRAAAITRLTALVSPVGSTGPPLDSPTLVTLVAGRVNLPEPVVEEVLFGREPDSDDDLQLAVDRLDTLMQAASQEQPRTDPGGTS